jgi:alkylhydroperoxidase/carboxymuconolactone decarboxylase family protein YurZ
VIPDVCSGYAHLRAAALDQAALDSKVEELIALVIDVTRGSDESTRGPPGAGATGRELAEAIGVALLMNGGPGVVHGQRASGAFRDAAGWR